MNVAGVKEVMKPEQFRNISVTYKTTDKKTKPKRKRFFGPEMLYLYLTGTYMGDPGEAEIIPDFCGFCWYSDVYCFV